MIKVPTKDEARDKLAVTTALTVGQVPTSESTKALKKAADSLENHLKLIIQEVKNLQKQIRVSEGPKKESSTPENTANNSRRLGR